MKKILIITGPTASGKTDLSIDIAKRYNGEIISADSRQIYRGLDYGSGKITKEEMQGIPHHMIDILNPEEEYSAYQFAKEAREKIEDIYSRNRVPIVVGGTIFYILSLIYKKNTSEVIKNEEFRKQKEKEAIPSLLGEIEKSSPSVLNWIDKNNKRRLIRALEIIKTLGYIPKRDKTPVYETLMIGIRHDRKTLKKRIEQRINKRWSYMLREIAEIIKNGVSEEWLISLGLEYKHITKMLINKKPQGETRKELLKDIYRFAKKQESFLKKEKVEWFELKK